MVWWLRSFLPCVWGCLPGPVMPRQPRSARKRSVAEMFPRRAWLKARPLSLSNSFWIPCSVNAASSVSMASVPFSGSAKHIVPTSNRVESSSSWQTMTFVPTSPATCASARRYANASSCHISITAARENRDQADHGRLRGLAFVTPADARIHAMVATDGIGAMNSSVSIPVNQIDLAPLSQTSFCSRARIRRTISVVYWSKTRTWLFGAEERGFSAVLPSWRKRRRMLKNDGRLMSSRWQNSQNAEAIGGKWVELDDLAADRRSERSRNSVLRHGVNTVVRQVVNKDLRQGLPTRRTTATTKRYSPAGSRLFAAWSEVGEHAHRGLDAARDVGEEAGGGASVADSVVEDQ